MASRPIDSQAMKMTSFFLKLCGFWPTHTQRGKIIMDAFTLYTLTAIITAIGITGIDMYKSYENIDRFTYCSMNICLASFDLYKLTSFILKRRRLVELIAYGNKHLWTTDYYDYGAVIMDKCMSRCNKMVIFAFLGCNITLLIHWVRPFIENAGKDITERDLPFKFYSNLPLYLSPWYEILYVIQMFCSSPCSYSYYSFDNLLNVMNLTLVGQFLILQKDIREICSDDDNTTLSDERDIHEKLVRCVRRHQQLIDCIESVKALYSDVMLGTVIIGSFLICLETFEAITSTSRNALYIIHYYAYAGGSIIQLYFYTLTCDDLTEASVAVSDAAYDAQWFLVKSGAYKNQLIKDLSMIIMRSHRACSLTVGGFSPVTLQTFTSICNTAFSFLTLMRQNIS